MFQQNNKCKDIDKGYIYMYTHISAVFMVGAASNHTVSKHSLN